MLLNSDEIIGIPMEIYIPEEKVAVESFAGTQEIDSLKEYLCRQRGIKFVIFISSDVDDDVAFIRKRFNEWRKINNPLFRIM